MASSNAGKPSAAAVTPTIPRLALPRTGSPSKRSPPSKLTPPPGAETPLGIDLVKVRWPIGTSTLELCDGRLSGERTLKLDGGQIASFTALTHEFTVGRRACKLAIWREGATPPAPAAAAGTRVAAQLYRLLVEGKLVTPHPVSYTHLTLPTICSV